MSGVRVEAQLVVTDLDVALEHWRDVLGFTIVFVHGDPPFYAQVERDGAHVNLRAVDEPVYVGDVRARESVLAAALVVGSAAEVDRLHEEWVAAGAVLHQPPRTEPWGARTMIVTDPDGNLILVAA